MSLPRPTVILPRPMDAGRELLDPALSLCLRTDLGHLLVVLGDARALLFLRLLKVALRVAFLGLLGGRSASWTQPDSSSSTDRVLLSGSIRSSMLLSLELLDVIAAWHPCSPSARRAVIHSPLAVSAAAGAPDGMPEAIVPVTTRTELGQTQREAGPFRPRNGGRPCGRRPG